MCARFYMEESPELRPFVEKMNRSPLLELFGAGAVTEGEVAPGCVSPVIAANKLGRSTVFPMRWGYTGRTLLINARSETAAVKPSFADGWAHRRCIIPASWYFEWEHFSDERGRKRTGDKYRLRPAAPGPVYLCGLYRMEEGLPHYVILTREPSPGIRFIHDRMPLMLPEKAAGEWVRPDARPEDLLGAAEGEIVFEKAV